jgi:hypothetical protein
MALRARIKLTLHIHQDAVKLFSTSKSGKCIVDSMTEHKFKIGDRLFVAHQLPDEAYVVIKRLPKRLGEFEYKIKKVDDELDERVVRESELRLSQIR